MQSTRRPDFTDIDNHVMITELLPKLTLHELLILAQVSKRYNILIDDLLKKILKTHFPFAALENTPSPALDFLERRK